jgi:hypothetical protein
MALTGRHTLKRSADVLDCVAWFLAPLLRWLFPALGRHRAGQTPEVVVPVDPPTLVLPRGADELARPYMLTAEEWQERRKPMVQRERRRALWLASHGIDVGPSRIHGMEVAG